MRIEARGRGGDRVGRDVGDGDVFERGDRGLALLDRRDQVGVLRAQVAPAGCAAVVAVARGRGSGLEVLGQRLAVGIREGLPDQCAADGLARRVLHRRAVRLPGQGELADARDEGGVADAEHEREDEHRADGDPGGAQGGAGGGHVRSLSVVQKPGMRLTTMSMSLMPMKGAMMPPRP